MVEMRVSPALTDEDAHSYISAVNERFRDEPTKYGEFLKVLNSLKTHRVDRGSVVAQVKELLKDHHDLLLGFNVFLSAEAKIVIPPEAKKAEQLAKSADTEKKHADAEDFMNKLKTRFGTLDTHVVGSFKAIMRMFKEGKMSAKEVHKEVTDILYYHEDLIKDFLRFFEKNDPLASASLLEL